MGEKHFQQDTTANSPTARCQEAACDKWFVPTAMATGHHSLLEVSSKDQIQS